MNISGITARIRRKKVNRKKNKPEYTKENILSRDFTAKVPNEKWLTYVTDKNRIEECGMTQSMSRVGKCIDNGPTEMFYGKEFKALEELKEKIVKCINFYNENRFQKRLGFMAPLEYRNHAYICA